MTQPRNVKMEKIKVFLSDQQVLFREGIHFILSGEDDFEVTGETTGNEEAFTLIEANPPNIAILSAYDVKTNGFDITRRIRRNLPSVFIVLIMDKKETDNIFQAIKSGASACLTKDIEPEHLLDIIRVVAQGSLPIMEELFTPGVASLILTEFADIPAINEQFDNLLAGISPKETQILNSIAASNNIEQIGAKLDMSEETIRRNIRLILNKLVSNDLSRTVIEAAQRNLPSIIHGYGKRNGNSTEYVTKAEFNEFKDHLMERFKSFIGELA
jgi:two-component system, NarL family, response regulator DevR